MFDTAYNEPGTVTAEAGWVILETPLGIAITLSPRAAAAAADRLLESSREAQRQRISAPEDGQPRETASNDPADAPQI